MKLKYDRKRFIFKTCKGHQDSLFFMKDKVDSSEVSINDCSTGMIWAVLLTRPMQRQSLKEGTDKV